MYIAPAPWSSRATTHPPLSSQATTILCDCAAAVHHDHCCHPYFIVSHCAAFVLMSALVLAAQCPWDGGTHKWETYPALLGHWQWHDANARSALLSGREGGGGGMPRRNQSACGLAATGREGGGCGSGGRAVALSRQWRCNARTAALLIGVALIKM